jgi:hypothetical protein
MDAPDRGALMLVRFIALSLLGVTIVNLTLYWVVSEHERIEMASLPCILKSIPAVIGVILLIKARAVAGWISDKLDE